jgi:hypothetical protein
VPISCRRKREYRALRLLEVLAVLGGSYAYFDYLKGVTDVSSRVPGRSYSGILLLPLWVLAALAAWEPWKSWGSLGSSSAAPRSPPALASRYLRIAGRGVQECFGRWSV